MNNIHCFNAQAKYIDYANNPNMVKHDSHIKTINNPIYKSFI